MTYQTMRALLALTLLAIGCVSPPQPAPAPTESWYQQSERRRQAYTDHVLKMAAELSDDYDAWMREREID